MMRAVKVWDLPTRVFHWSLVVLVVTSWLTAEDEGPLYVVHTLSGYLVFLLLLFRLAWGWLGNERARFRDFVRPWPAVRAYLGGLMRLQPDRSLGHNPLGGWMVVLLLAILLAIALTGMIGAAREPGALLAGIVPRAVAGIFRELHEGLANFLYLLVAVHVVGVLLDWLLTGDNLIRAMVNGRKPAEDGIVAADARGGSAVVALVLVAILAVLGAYMVARTTF
jgi:cytochrome b